MLQGSKQHSSRREYLPASELVDFRPYIALTEKWCPCAPGNTFISLEQYRTLHTVSVTTISKVSRRRAAIEKNHHVSSANFSQMCFEYMTSLIACVAHVFLSHCSVVKSVHSLVLSAGSFLGPRTPASLRARKNTLVRNKKTSPEVLLHKHCRIWKIFKEHQNCFVSKYVKWLFSPKKCFVILK